MHSRIKSFMLSAFAAAMCSCAQQVVPSSGPRPATFPDVVRIYQKKPTQYEDLGLVTLEITPDLGWDTNGDANGAFDQMKAKAAALGATGLLLEVDPSHYDILTQAGYHGVYYQVPSKKKVAFGEAIYVLKE